MRLRSTLPRTLLAALAVAALTPASATAATCSLHAATTGSDAATGTAAAPLRTVQRLADRLTAGQTGCLAPGLYEGGVTVRRGGTATARLQIRATQPRTATILGQVRIDDGANFVTFADLRLDGSNTGGRPSPLVNGDDARFAANEVTSAADSCFVLGDKVWGIADRTVITGNEIHHCGVTGTNMDHGVYVRQARGTVVTANVIHDNPDRGVQLFPNADDSVVRGNLIQRNGVGVIFSGDSIDTSDRNLVEANVIRDSRDRFDVESYWWNGNIGSGNVVRRNCVAGGLRGAIQLPAIGFTSLLNILAVPGPGSACLLAVPVV